MDIHFIAITIMIFILFFREIDWSPSLITLFLILVNCVIFFAFQSDDRELVEKAYKFYLDSELPVIDLPLYIEHLNQLHQFQKTIPYEQYDD